MNSFRHPPDENFHQTKFVTHYEPAIYLLYKYALYTFSPPPASKICHKYSKVMKLGTVIDYLKKIEKNI